MSKKSRKINRGNSGTDPHTPSSRSEVVKAAVVASHTNVGTVGAGAAAIQYTLACVHERPRMALKLGKTHIWGGPRSLAILRNWGLVIACGTPFYNASSGLAPVSANAAAQGLLPEELYKFAPPPMLTLQWSDAGVPALPISYWEAMLAFLQGFHKDVYFCCDGGHGRTGTALSIIYGLACKKPVDPVAVIRKCYCNEAVETTSQVEYIEHITGQRVNVLSSYMTAHYEKQGVNYGLTYGDEHTKGKWDD